MEGKTINALDINGKEVTGKVILVYDEGIVSGSNGYTSITMLLVEDKDGVVRDVRPRNVNSISEKKIPEKNTNIKYRAFMELAEDGWNERIVVYDEMNNKVANSNAHHPQGFKSFHWNGFEFIYPHSYGGKDKAPCYVMITDKISFEQSSNENI